jgi:hypothetical protein
MKLINLFVILIICCIPQAVLAHSHAFVEVRLNLVFDQEGLAPGLAMGGLLAAFHGASGIMLVVAINLILNGSITTSLPQATQTTQIISYGLISLLGLIMLLHCLWELRKPEGSSPSTKLSETPPWPPAWCPAPGLSW